ncbi:MAG: redoxin domain-containing protein [Candidatus Binataceae bacterium]
MRAEDEARPDAEAAPAADPQSESAAIEEEYVWVTPPFQPLRAILALALTIIGFGLYEWVLLNFWSSPSLGIHERIPWAAYLLIAAALVIELVAIRTALRMWSPHGKLGFSLLAFGACAAIAIGGGRFVSYTLRGTLNPPFKLNLAIGEHFSSFALPDQNGVVHQGPTSPGMKATLIYVYRGDFCPFARHEIADLATIAPGLRESGANVIAISADPVDRSKMLAGFLNTDIPLLSDEHEMILGPLGLVQHHRDGEPDNAIPGFFVVDGDGVVRWIFTSPYYRQLPRSDDLVAAVCSVTDSARH